MSINLNVAICSEPNLKKIRDEIVLCWYGEDEKWREFIVELCFHPLLENSAIDFKDAKVIFIIESDHHKARILNDNNKNTQKRYGNRFFSIYFEINNAKLTVKIAPADTKSGFIYPKRYPK